MERKHDRVFEDWQRTDTRRMRYSETARWHLDRRASARGCSAASHASAAFAWCAALAAALLDR